MSRKKKSIVWHKKKNKFIDASLIKPHQAKDQEEKSQEKAGRRQRFAKSLSDQIKKAVQKSSNRSS